MEFIALILYGTINVAMVASCLRTKGDICQFPFWLGVISLGWFFPQAIGGFYNPSLFPDSAYTTGMLFASLCTIAAWVGYARANAPVSQEPTKPCWLDAPYTMDKLFYAGAFLCAFGFFFQWKVASMPEEILGSSQWSGAVVKYLFLGSVFKFGFVTLLMLYLIQRKKFPPRLLVFLIPALLLLLQAALIRGRRAEMMNLAAYMLVTPWFVRRYCPPRWMLFCGLGFGILLINSIGVYRSIMNTDDAPLKERIKQAMHADYSVGSEDVVKESGVEFKNYIFYRYIYEDQGTYDFGIKHWNGLVFNYVPAQLVGRGLKKALMLPYKDDTAKIAKTDYGHSFGVGSTNPGYTDAFASFWWLGFLKFSVIGWMMGVLYRHAMAGSFLGQMLYVYSLSTAMHSVTHGTHAILFSTWVYFFALGYPILYLAKVK